MTDQETINYQYSCGHSDEPSKKVTAADIRLVKQTNCAKDDPTYRAFLSNGDDVGLIGKGWTRVGGQGWVVHRKNESSSLTKRNLDECKRWIAARINKQQQLETHHMNTKKQREVKQAQVGDLIGVRNVTCRITKIRPFGTVDCVSLNGKHAYRVSGLIGLTAVGLMYENGKAV